MNEVILGIDPGFHVTGYAVIKKDGAKAFLLDCGYLQMSPKKHLSERVGEFYSFFSNIIGKYSITQISLETSFLGKNAQTFLKLGFLRGLLYLLADQNKLALKEFSPREVKLSITGFGGATKEQVADAVLRMFPKLSEIKKIAKTLAKSEHIYTIGRGVSYPTALESALKMKEVSYIHTEGLAGGELKHGAIALISKGTPCILYAPDDETFESIISNATEIKSRGGLIIGVGPKNSESFDHWVPVKDVGEASLIPMVVPAQLLAYFLALGKGWDPDKPRNLAKSVTVK